MGGNGLWDMGIGIFVVVCFNCESELASVRERGRETERARATEHVWIERDECEIWDGSKSILFQYNFKNLQLKKCT